MDDFSYLKRPKLMETLAVIDARNFRVIEPQADTRQKKVLSIKLFGPIILALKSAALLF